MSNGEPASDLPLSAAERSDSSISQDEQRSAEALLGEAEPWESWETRLVVGSIAIAIVGLIVLGWLINSFILS
jgi:hypothetical protein